MAIQEATLYSFGYIEARDLATDNTNLLEVLFTISGTYAAADGCRFSDLATVLNTNAKGSLRVQTVIDAMRGRSGSQQSDPSKSLGIKTVAVSGANVTFKLTDQSFTTELADGAIPAQSRPLSMLVWVAKVAV